MQPEEIRDAEPEEYAAPHLEQARVSGNATPSRRGGSRLRLPVEPHQVLHREGGLVTQTCWNHKAPANDQGCFAALAGALSPEEAAEMDEELRREFGMLEGEW